MTTWVEGAGGSLFDVDNLPYGVFSRGDEDPRVGVRIGDHVLDLSPWRPRRCSTCTHVFESRRSTRCSARAAGLGVDRTLGWSACSPTRPSAACRAAPRAARPTSTLHLPFTVGDYVDFYASLDHASNVGRIFRPDQEPLLPNWRHLPVGYHGRGGTVVASAVRRSSGRSGQRKAPHEDAPTFGPSRRLDIEAELGFVVGAGSALGSRIAADEFADHVFGVVGLNDWSARDIQAWEYVPLGPFLGKSFATSVCAWVTPLAALDAAWTDLPGQDPSRCPTCAGGATPGLDIEVEVVLNGEVVSRPPYRTMYWSPAQMLAHLTVNGASTRTGDLFASGTISGPEPDQRGSFLELSWGGKEPFGAAARTFLEDGDEVVLRYSAPGTGGGRIALGEVTGRIEPAR